MKVEVPRGKYVLAVSGGVDSMTLLDLLAKQPGIELVVAHFNHGIRQDAAKGERLVREATARYGLVFESGQGNLGKAASEETARKARYSFLFDIRGKHQALKVITAHHQDDAIETAMINLLRGTGRRGLSSINSNPDVLRPLLSTSKRSVLKYARDNNLRWLEDSSNGNQNYLRNYLRHNVLSKMSEGQRANLIDNLDKVAKTNKTLDDEFATISRIIGNLNIDRLLFSSLPTGVGAEYVAYLFSTGGIQGYDSKTVDRISLAVKTAAHNSVQPIKHGSHLKLTASTATIVTS